MKVEEKGQMEKKRVERMDEQYYPIDGCSFVPFYNICNPKTLTLTGDRRKKIQFTAYSCALTFRHSPPKGTDGNS